MKSILPFLFMLAISQTVAADIPTITGPNIPNPGNGEFRMINNTVTGFSTITVVQADAHIVLTGTLTAYSGGYSATIDLATERSLILAGPVPALRIVLDGVDPLAEFQIALR